MLGVVEVEEVEQVRTAMDGTSRERKSTSTWVFLIPTIQVSWRSSLARSHGHLLVASTTVATRESLSLSLCRTNPPCATLPPVATPLGSPSSV